MRKKLLIALGVFVIILIPVFAFRKPLLRCCSAMLIKQDNLQVVDALFVLSGGAYDRGNEAVRIYNNGYAPVIICTGANPVVELKSIDIDTLESDMTVANLHRQLIADSLIRTIRYGTSTFEEADTILGYCKANGYKKIMVLSSLLHTGRVNKVFRKKFRQEGITLLVRGAPSSRFKEELWWESEDGLIAVNNEWLKTFYYWWKY